MEFTLSKSLRNNINDFHDIRYTVTDIIDCDEKYGIASLNIYYLTNKQIKNIDNLASQVGFKGVEHIARIHYWDLTRWGEVVSSKTKREPISFNFRDLSYKVRLISLENQTKNIKTHLGIIPTQLLYDLYSIYNVRLLENNVRVHLQRKKQLRYGENSY